MALKKIYITSVPGLGYVQAPELAYVEVMLVMREGKMLVETTASPVGKEFYHRVNEGKIEPWTGLPFNGEEVYVLYKD